MAILGFPEPCARSEFARDSAEGNPFVRSATPQHRSEGRNADAKPEVNAGAPFSRYRESPGWTVPNPGPRFPIRIQSGAHGLEGCVRSPSPTVVLHQPVRLRAAAFTPVPCPSLWALAWPERIASLSLRCRQVQLHASTSLRNRVAGMTGAIHFARCIRQRNGLTPYEVSNCGSAADERTTQRLLSTPAARARCRTVAPGRPSTPNGRHSVSRPEIATSNNRDCSILEVTDRSPWTSHGTVPALALPLSAPEFPLLRGRMAAPDRLSSNPGSLPPAMR